MASWESIQKEMIALNRGDSADIVRRQKLAGVQAITGRPLIIYAADFSPQNPVKAQLTGQGLNISLSDKDGFDEVTRNIEGPNLDVLLHSPGGSAEATESIVELLRARFENIRFIVPSVAKSAATIMAMAGNQLVMDERSELGPTDPQMVMAFRDRGTIAAPAQAIKDQFKTAQDEINADASKLPSWVPILGMYGPSLLAQCDNHLALSERLVAEWLERYMFAGDSDAHDKAQVVAAYLANHNNFLSHARRVGIDKLQELNVNVLDMRTDPALRDAVGDLYTALMLTFATTMCYKVFENGQGNALILNVQQVEIMQQVNVPQGPMPMPPGPPQLGPLQQRQPRQPSRPDQPPRGQRNRGR